MNFYSLTDKAWLFGAKCLKVIIPDRSFIWGLYKQFWASFNNRHWVSREELIELIYFQ